MNLIYYIFIDSLNRSNSMLQLQANNDSSFRLSVIDHKMLSVIEQRNKIFINENEILLNKIQTKEIKNNLKIKKILKIQFNKIWLCNVMNLLRLRFVFRSLLSVEVEFI